MSHLYDTDLDKNPANYAPLSPLSFLRRTRDVYPLHSAVIHGERCYSWAETYQRCVRLADVLRARGIRPGDTVAIMASNIPEMFEARFAIAMAGGVINAINIRLDAATVRFILSHGEARAFLVDREFAPVAEEALRGLEEPPLVVGIDDPGRWDDLPADERAPLKARQGVRGHMLEDLMVADPQTMEPVPMDGVTLGRCSCAATTS